MRDRVFDSMEALYIADSHHHSTAASRVAAATSTRALIRLFSCRDFPHHQTKIMNYNRVVKDLHDLEKSALMIRLDTAFTVGRGKPQPRASPHLLRQVQHVSGGQTARRIVSAHPQTRTYPHDPVARLDVSLRSYHLLAPVLDIADLRHDKRIDFVGGIRRLGELEKRVDSGDMAVADSGQVMPINLPGSSPSSLTGWSRMCWIKLRCHLFDKP